MSPDVRRDGRERRHWLFGDGLGGRFPCRGQEAPQSALPIACCSPGLRVKMARAVTSRTSSDREALARLGLGSPRSAAERLHVKLVSLALRETA